MFMDGIFPDTVAPIRRLNEIKTSLVVMTLFAGVHPCVGSTAPPHLTSYPESATDGADFTLSCTPAQGRTLIGVKWHRNNVQIFDTSSDAYASAAILHPLTTSPEYQSVSGRISVSSSLQQHNVTLRTNSPLDQGSVWRCKTGPQLSNKLTVVFKDCIQDTSSAEGPSSTDDKDMITMNQTTTLTQSASSTHDKDMTTTNPTVSTQTPFIHTAEFIYVVAGSAGGVVIVVVIVIVVLLCIRSRREGKCQTNEAEKDNCKEGGHNEESEREAIVMEDNDLYHGFVRTENQESAEEQQVADVYAKVNKVRKTHNATEVQITLNIEDMYAKPNKTASGNRKASHKVSSSQNEDVNTPD